MIKRLKLNVNHGLGGQFQHCIRSKGLKISPIER